MDFNLRVFISSTTVDLVDYRQAADRAIRALGATSDDMVLWSADERDGSTVSLDRVRQCDVVILIVAHRYGYVPDGVDYSITEQEYRTAQAGGIPVLAFLLDETVPWPPKFIERDRPADLTRFRQAIEKHVTRQLFRSPDELSRLITQALVAFAARTKVGRPQRLSERAIAVAAPIQLKSVPDAVVPLGHAEDDSPLLLRVTRSIDFTPLLDRLAQAISRPAAEFPSALFKTFQQSLQQNTRAAWSSERLKLVTMRDGSERQMYVTSATLSDLFRPLLSLLLSTPVSPDGDLGHPMHTRPRARRKDPGDQATAVAYPANHDTSTPVAPAALQSVGGRNRFLGVALDDGGIFSVGYEGAQCVEWRPFVCESLPSHVPQGRFRAHWSNGTVDGTFDGVLAEYQANLDREARRFPTTHSCSFRLNVVVSLPRSSLAELLAKIADQLAHTTFIHGDLKAGNVILARKGPLLIDAFDLREGVRSPGWSPNWSAPEQVLGLPVTPAADVYPLGVMLVQLLDGEMLGEVRKFRTLPTPDGRDEFSVFYDPYVYVERSDVEWADRSRSKWVAFARSCLRFDPEKRCQSPAAFSDQIRSLLHDEPLPASKRLVLVRDAWPATLVDGTDRLATIIDDMSPSIPTDSEPPSDPTRLLGPSDPFQTP